MTTRSSQAIPHEQKSAYILFLRHYALLELKLVRLIEKGGDWDRRNRLKVYQGLHSLSIRQFKRACDLFVDALSTFTATELLSYNDFVSLTMIAGALTLKRPDLKKKVRDISSDFFQRLTVLQIIMAPEVISVIGELPILSELVHALYDCHYNKLFIALGQQQSTFMSEKISDVQTSKIGGYIPVPLTDPQRPRSVLCAGNAHIGIRATSRKLPLVDAGEHEHSVRCEHRLHRQVCHISRKQILRS